MLKITEVIQASGIVSEVIWALAVGIITAQAIRFCIVPVARDYVPGILIQEGKDLHTHHISSSKSKNA